jgi:hypothetical protein
MPKLINSFPTTFAFIQVLLSRCWCAIDRFLEDSQLFAFDDEEAPFEDDG